MPLGTGIVSSPAGGWGGGGRFGGGRRNVGLGGGGLLQILRHVILGHTVFLHVTCMQAVLTRYNWQTCCCLTRQHVHSDLNFCHPPHIQYTSKKSATQGGGHQ